MMKGVGCDVKGVWVSKFPRGIAIVCTGCFFGKNIFLLAISQARKHLHKLLKPKNKSNDNVQFKLTIIFHIF
jgi:hypothetical protein